MNKVKPYLWQAVLMCQSQSNSQLDKHVNNCNCLITLKILAPNSIKHVNNCNCSITGKIGRDRGGNIDIFPPKFPRPVTTLRKWKWKDGCAGELHLRGRRKEKAEEDREGGISCEDHQNWLKIGLCILKIWVQILIDTRRFWKSKWKRWWKRMSKVKDRDHENRKY